MGKENNINNPYFPLRLHVLQLDKQDHVHLEQVKTKRN